MRKVSILLLIVAVLVLISFFFDWIVLNALASAQISTNFIINLSSTNWIRFNETQNSVSQSIWNETFGVNENYTFWITLPKNSNIVDAKINLSGYSLKVNHSSELTWETPHPYSNNMCTHNLTAGVSGSGIRNFTCPAGTTQLRVFLDMQVEAVYDAFAIFNQSNNAILGKCWWNVNYPLCPNAGSYASTSADSWCKNEYNRGTTWTDWYSTDSIFFGFKSDTSTTYFGVNVSAIECKSDVFDILYLANGTNNVVVENITNSWLDTASSGQPWEWSGEELFNGFENLNEWEVYTESGYATVGTYNSISLNSGNVKEGTYSLNFTTNSTIPAYHKLYSNFTQTFDWRNVKNVSVWVYPYQILANISLHILNSSSNEAFVWNATPFFPNQWNKVVFDVSNVNPLILGDVYKIQFWIYPIDQTYTFTILFDSFDTFDGQFDTSKPFVDLNKTLINNFLSTCAPDANGNCDLPIKLHSDTVGKIQISAINITYDYNISSLYNVVKHSDRYYEVTSNGNLASNDLSLSGYYVKTDRNNCLINGTSYPIQTDANGNKYCGISFAIPKGSKWFNHTIIAGSPFWLNNQTSIPSTYDYSIKSYFNITWNDSLGYSIDTVLFESNFSGTPKNYTMVLIDPYINATEKKGVYNFNLTLPAGTFYWKSYANASDGIWNSTPKWEFTINKATPIIKAYVNGSDSTSLSEPIRSIINLTGVVNTAYPTTICLDLNYSGYGNNFQCGSNVVTNFSNFTTAGVYNFTAHFDGDENYTASSYTIILSLVAEGSPTYSNVKTKYVSPVEYNPDIVYHQFNITWYDVDGISDVIFEFNKTINYTFKQGQVLNNSNEFYINLSLKVGNYTYKWYANDTGNNWGETLTYSYDYVKNSTNPINVWFSYGGNTYYNQNIAVDTSTLVTINANLTYINSGTLVVKLDNAIITGLPFSATFGVGTHTVNASTAGNENYTSNTTIYTITVTGETSGGGGGYIPSANVSFEVYPLDITKFAEAGEHKLLVSTAEGYTFLIKNTGPNAIYIGIRIEGDYKDWLSLSEIANFQVYQQPMYIEIKPGNTVGIKLYTNIPLDAKAGTYPITVIFQDRDSQVYQTAKVNLVINPAFGVIYNIIAGVSDIVQKVALYPIDFSPENNFNITKEGIYVKSGNTVRVPIGWLLAILSFTVPSLILMKLLKARAKKLKESYKKLLVFGISFVCLILFALYLSGVI
jgi:hypothetical protein